MMMPLLKFMLEEVPDRLRMCYEGRYQAQSVLEWKLGRL
jgi:hypothetical protein